MATRTTTVQVVRDGWAALAGLDPDNITTEDARVFTEFINRNYRNAWMRAEWPFSVASVAKTPDSNGLIDLSADVVIADVLDVFDANPFTSTEAKHVSYQLSGSGDIYVASKASTEVFVFYRGRETEFTATLSTTLEFVFKDYLASACYADFLLGEGQKEKSIAQRAEAESILDLEVDRLERQQQQVTPNYISTRIVGSQ